MGIISGWSFFCFWIGLWVSPQPDFRLHTIYPVKILIIEVPILHVLLSLFFLFPALYFGLGGLAELGLKVSETHRPEKVITRGIYSRVRHPQYLGGLFGHISMTLLFSGLYSLYVTPIVIAEVYLIAQKEEKELIKEFGADYKTYQEKVPMFIIRR